MYDKIFFINTSKKADRNIEDLKNTLVDIACKQQTWGRKMPTVWLTLELQISDLKADGEKIIKKERLLEISKSNTDLEIHENTVTDFLLAQHSMGKLLYFGNPSLQDFVVIQPTAMVSIVRSFITDCNDLPTQEPICNILKNLSVNGVVKKNELFILWSHSDAKNILIDDRKKEYVLQVLIYHDILIKFQYDTEKNADTDFLLVSSFVREPIRNNVRIKATDENTICLAFHLKESTEPSMLLFKLIGESISLLPLKEVNSRVCLYFQATILEADNRNELQIHVEGQKIVAYLINEVSKHLISPDLATTIQECLTSALRRVLQVKTWCFGELQNNELFTIEVGGICNGETCVIPLSEANITMEWTCKNGTSHETKSPLHWVFDKVSCIVYYFMLFYYFYLLF